MSFTEKKLEELGLKLPTLARPVGSYVPWVRSGNLIYVSGQLPLVDGKLQFPGRLGDTVSLSDGAKAAEICALNILAHLNDACGNDLDQIKQLVKIIGFVAATPDFTDHPKVVNGASDFFGKVLGERGPHARSSVGSSSLPLGACIEIEALAEVD